MQVGGFMIIELGLSEQLPHTVPSGHSLPFKWSLSSLHRVLNIKR